MKISFETCQRHLRCLMALGLMLVPTLLVADDPDLPKINVVLFTPSDVKPPKVAVERLTQVADYTEAFLIEGMKEWEYAPKRTSIFERTKDNKLQVLFVKGDEKRSSGKYDNVGLEREVWPKANAQYNLKRHRHIWWIWVYLGDPPEKFQGFRGGGDSKGGGNALVNYVNAKGEIKSSDEIGNPFNEEFTLKGTMHELGHALGLPHIGPIEADDRGMPLMGANIPNYRRKTRSQERRGFLSQASAAMLWKHPVFTGTTKDRDVLPPVEVQNLTIFAGQGRGLSIKGKLKSNYSAHSVVLLDNVPNVHEKYWQKPYTARIDERGEFDIQLTEPAGLSGTFKFLFCFENGAVTGDGKGYGISSAYERNYRVTGRKYELVNP